MVYNTPNSRTVSVVVTEHTSAGAARGGAVTPDSLKAAGIIKRSARWVKVLGKGEITGAFAVSAHHFSKGAREKIEKAGGSVTVLAGRHGRTAATSKGERHAARSAARSAKILVERAAGAVKAKAAKDAKDARDADAEEAGKAPKPAKAPRAPKPDGAGAGGAKAPKAKKPKPE